MLFPTALKWLLLLFEERVINDRGCCIQPTFQQTTKRSRLGKTPPRTQLLSSETDCGGYGARFCNKLNHWCFTKKFFARANSQVRRCCRCMSLLHICVVRGSGTGAAFVSSAIFCLLYYIRVIKSSFSATIQSRALPHLLPLLHEDDQEDRDN